MLRAVSLANTLWSQEWGAQWDVCPSPLNENSALGKQQQQQHRQNTCACRHTAQVRTSANVFTRCRHFSMNTHARCTHARMRTHMHTQANIHACTCPLPTHPHSLGRQLSQLLLGHAQILQNRHLSLIQQHIYQRHGSRLQLRACEGEAAAHLREQRRARRGMQVLLLWCVFISHGLCVCMCCSACVFFKAWMHTLILT